MNKLFITNLNFGAAMGHLSGKNLYRKLGKKIDNLSIRAPWNDAFYNIVKELYTPEEADLIIKMPYTLSSLNKIAIITKYEKRVLEKLIDALCSKGLVLDLWLNGKYLYVPSPLVIGIFEFTMMRTGKNLSSDEWGKLFYKYMGKTDTFHRGNFGKGEKSSLMRVVPYEDAFNSESYVEVLDYEKASAIIDGTDKFGIGICSCRHEKLHAGVKTCDVPLEMCASFGKAADYLIRHGMAKEVSRKEMMENLEKAKELSLVINSDNVKKNITFICFCCKCCCNVLAGLTKFGFQNSVVTSNYIAENSNDSCTGCSRCLKVCPAGAIEMADDNSDLKRKKLAVTDDSLCIGCGVCTLNCNPGSMGLKSRERRIFTPENTFEKIILRSLDSGNLQNQIFDNPQSISHRFLRGFLGGFLKLPPVKKTIMSDRYRSRFLKGFKKGTDRTGKGWLEEL